MTKIVIPETYNYIGVFLTFACNLQCSYCINHQYGAKQHYKQLSTEDWIRGLNRIETRDDLPISLQGGEPSMYKGLYDIIAGVDKKINIDILTNMQFSSDDWIAHVRPERLKRVAKYANIRVSYHPEQMELEALIYKVKKLQDAGFSIGVWIVDHPGDKTFVHVSQDIISKEGIDCRLKEFLGEYKGKWYGTYKYPEAVNGECRSVMCKPSELLIAPDGSIHKCHNSVYIQHRGYGHILDEHVKLIDDYRECSQFGQCNSCDVKLKTNRFQEYGHASVEIKEVLNG